VMDFTVCGIMNHRLEYGRRAKDSNVSAVTKEM
jgi:hypothetical protein